MIKRKKQRSLEAEGFYHGTQEIPAEPGQSELTANICRAQEEVRLKAVDRLKGLEAQRDTVRRRQADAEKQWRVLEAETKGMPPEMAMPLLATALAVLAVNGETFLLAPVMDGFGIAQWAWQLFTALVLVLVSSGLLELSIRQLRPPEAFVAQAEEDPQQKRPRQSGLWTAATVLLTLFAFVLIFVLGWWRAEEMIFAGEIQQAEWGNFLQKHPDLTRACVVLLTMGLPVFAALAFDWGFYRVRYAKEWHKAKREYQRYSQLLDQIERKLDAEIEKRDRRITLLDQQKQEWKDAYLENYELGKEVGAHKQPLWQVLLKIAAVILLILGACILIDPFIADQAAEARPWLYGFVTFGLGGLYAYRALKGWDRPTPLQIYKHRAVKWRSEVEPSISYQTAEKTTELLPEDVTPTSESRAALPEEGSFIAESEPEYGLPKAENHSGGLGKKRKVS